MPNPNVEGNGVRGCIHGHKKPQCPVSGCWAFNPLDPLDLRNWFGPMSDSRKAAALSKEEYSAKRKLAVEAGIISDSKTPSCLS